MKSIAVILAAGKGTRMQSDLPKVLHRLAERPLVHHVVDTAKRAGMDHSVAVIGYGAEQVQASLDTAFPAELSYALQKEQRGTGHAVMAAMPAIEAWVQTQGAAATEDARVVILSGDVPRLQASTLRRMLDEANKAASGLSFATMIPPEAGAYGRVLRDGEHKVQAIREARDCAPEQLEIKECNAGIYCAPLSGLRRWLPRLAPENDQGEYYLTDIVAMALEDGEVAGVVVDPDEVAGINTKAQLEEMNQNWSPGPEQ